MKKLGAMLVMGGLVAALATPTQARGPRGGAPLPAPEHADVSYGDHERNALDVWLAESDGPTPLVIFFHGGGFRNGDKRSMSLTLLEGLLAEGISVAAVNYRLSHQALFPAQMHDSARAVQFLRAHAADYNLDPARFGATGGSAGAGISLWLGYHDDLADPTSADPLAQQSTRLAAVGVKAAQASYDPRVHFELFSTDQLDPAMQSLYGMSGPEDVDDPAFQAMFEEASAMTHASADDPPTFLFYPQVDEDLGVDPPAPRYIHHPAFGRLLSERLTEVGVEHTLKLRGDYATQDLMTAPDRDIVAFFVAELAAAAQPAGPEAPAAGE